MTDEKNEVLAKWAGFEKHILTGRIAQIDSWYWTGPDGFSEPFLPDLLHSLDAQAKWLWPKLKFLSIVSPEDPPDDVRYVVEARLSPVEFGLAVKSTPAEACAEAILSLINDG